MKRFYVCNLGAYFRPDLSYDCSISNILFRHVSFAFSSQVSCLPPLCISTQASNKMPLLNSMCVSSRHLTNKRQSAAILLVIGRPEFHKCSLRNITRHDTQPVDTAVSYTGIHFILCHGEIGHSINNVKRDPLEIQHPKYEKHRLGLIESVHERYWKMGHLSRPLALG